MLSTVIAASLSMVSLATALAVSAMTSRLAKSSGDVEPKTIPSWDSCSGALEDLGGVGVEGVLARDELGGALGELLRGALLVGLGDREPLGHLLVVGAGLGLGVDRAGLGGLGRDLRRLRPRLGPLRRDDALLGDREGRVGALEVDEGPRRARRWCPRAAVRARRSSGRCASSGPRRSPHARRGPSPSRRSMRRRGPRPSAWPRDRSSHTSHEPHMPIGTTRHSCWREFVTRLSHPVGASSARR